MPESLPPPPPVPTVPRHGLPRELRDHHIDWASQQIRIVADEPNPHAGDASHRYSIIVGDELFPLEFQQGSVMENGVNGITNEALLAILIDRLTGFQTGKLADDRNGEALFHCRQALDALHARTRDRIERGVEGTKEP